MDAVDNYKKSRRKLFEKFGINPQTNEIATVRPVKKVHYLELGAGRPLIIIHGGGSNSSEWLNILKPLAEHFKLYVVDRPGCGLSGSIDYRGVAFRESAVDFVQSFMDALGLKKAAFLGQSMGGYFSICFAMKYPERVEKLVMVGAPAGMNFWIPFLLRLLGVKGLNRFLFKTVAKPSPKNALFIHKQLLVADVKNLSDAYIEHCYHGQLLPGYKTGFLTMLENVLTARGWRKGLYIGDQLHELKVPVRFIWGDKDAFESFQTGRDKAMAIPDHVFVVVKDAGHSPWLDQPEKCSSKIISMLEN